MDISIKQEKWRQERPLFEAEFIHSHLLPYFNFNESTGDYEIKSEVEFNEDEDRKLAYLKDRYVTLEETKNGTKRHVPLSKRAVELLELMKGINSHNVFTVKDASFDTLWRKLRDKCEIEDLHFHDSRHEACTRLARKLEVLDLARMIGHKDLRSLMVYYNATASEIANRLD